MARLVPDDVAERDQGLWHASERATLNKLAVMLSEGYIAFRGSNAYSYTGSERAYEH